MNPAALQREERLVLLVNEDRVRRAVVLGCLFLAVGLAGKWISAGGQGDAWLPLLGVPFVMIAAIAYVWAKTHCPRCDQRVLTGRWRLPATCPRCGVALLKPPEPAAPPAEATVQAREPD